MKLPTTIKPRLKAVTLYTRVLAALLVTMGFSLAHAQTFKSTEGNNYLGSSTGGGREGNCLEEKEVKRRVNVNRDTGANRLTYTMYIEGKRTAIYRGSNRTQRMECDPGTENFTATIRFYIDKEDATRTDYSGTVIEASKGGLHGFKLGERISGSVEVFDGGRGLDFNEESFIDGVARVLASQFKNNVGPEQAYYLPNKTPDIVVNCKVISADGNTTSKNYQNSGQSSQGKNNNSFSNQGNSITNNSCLAYGWQNIRKSISVWLTEKRCDGYSCEIGPNVFRWKNGELNRHTGQMKDGCYTYECDKASTTTRF